MKHFSVSKLQQYFSITLTAVIFIYLAFRSALVPLIHDEAVTYFAYIAPFNFIPGYAYWDANNHLLFSAIGAIINSIFNYSILMVRSASLIFFPLYAFFAYRIGKQLYSPFLATLFFIVMITAPFTIEFFSLARGYGIGLTFFVGLIYQILKQQESNDFDSYLLILAYAILCLLGNLSFFVGVAMVIGYFFIVWIVTKRPKVIKVITRSFFFILGLFPLVYYMFELKNRELLYYGGDSFLGFFIKPFASLYLSETQFWPLLIIPLAIAIVLTIQDLKRFEINEIKNPLLFPFVLLISLAGIVLLQWILKINYPEDRASLYFFPLTIGVMFNALQSLPRKRYWFLAIPFVWFPVDLLLNANTTYSRLWVYEYTPERFYQHVGYQENGYPETLSARGLRKQIWAAAQFKKPKTTNVCASDAPSTIADYILIDSTRIDTVDHGKYKVIDYDSISGQYFFERKNKVQWTPYSDTIVSDINTSNVYFNLFEYLKNPFQQKALKLHFAFTPPKENSEYPLTLISSVFDTNGGIIFYEKLNLDEITAVWEPKEYKFTQYLPYLPENTGRIVFYLYNFGEQPYAMKNVKASLFTLSNETN